MPAADRGAALLEVLAATVLLAVAGLAMIQLLSGHSAQLATARSRESELRDEARILSAHVLLTRSDLERRLGNTTIGPYLVSVQRPEAELFRLAISRRDALLFEDLVTVVFRPREGHAP